MAENFKTRNLVFNSWPSAFAQGTEAVLGKPGEGRDLTEATRGEVEANPKVCHQQAEDWRKIVAPQMAPGMENGSPINRTIRTPRRGSCLSFKENRLVKGTCELAGESPPWAKALGPVVGNKDLTELPLPGGQVGVYVSSKSQRIVGNTVFEWLIESQ